MIRIICGSLMVIFGFFGFAMEISDYQSNRSWDLFGLLLAAIMVVVGGCLFLFGRSARSYTLTSEIPVEIKGWNWGAFFLNWIWGIGNNSYRPFLTFIPIVGLIMPFVCGAKGNKWAWTNKRWDSVDHFKSTQRKWAIAGITITPAFVFSIVLSVTLIMKSSVAYKTSLQEVVSNQEVQAYFGTPIEPGIFVTGSVRISRSDGKAELSYSISGPKNKGKVHVCADKHIGKWSIYQLVVFIPEIEKQITIIAPRSAVY